MSVAVEADKANDQASRSRKRVDGRARRHALGHFLQKRSALPSVRKCGQPLEPEVTIGCHETDTGMVAHVGGIGRCGSPWACPVCTPVVREERAREIDQAVSAALLAGWTVLMVSCTVPHSWADKLARTFGIVRDGHRRTRTGRAWQEFRSTYGYVGAIRAWEMTRGVNGWHPHSHELVILQAGWSKSVELAVREHYEHTYGVSVETATGRMLHGRHGIDVRRVRTAPELARYLTKVDGGWGAGLEVARSDIKTSNGGVNPWQLLGNWHDDGDTAQRALWQEYEKATYGTRAITWSPGLRATLLPEVEEKTDEEAAAAAPPGEPVWSIVLPACAWQDVRREGATAQLLEACEIEAARGAPPP